MHPAEDAEPLLELVGFERGNQARFLLQRGGGAGGEGSSELEADPAWEAGSCEGQSPERLCRGCQCPLPWSVPG